MAHRHLPTGWAWVTADQLAVHVPNALAIGPFGSSLKVADYTEFGVPLVFVRDIRKENFGGASTRFVSTEKAQLLAAHLVRPGDLLVTKMGDPPGDTTVYPEGRPAAIITADCIKLTPETRLASAKYLAFMLRSPDVRGALLDQTKGVAQQKLSLERFRQIPLPLPPVNEQHQLVVKLESLLTRSRTVRDSMERLPGLLERLRHAVLASAFSGELHGGADRTAVDEARASKLLSLGIRVDLVPRHWRWVSLAEVSDIYSGVAFPPALQGRREGAVPLFKVGDISRAHQAGERWLGSAEHYISREEADRLGPRLFTRGSVVFAKVGAAIALNRRAILQQDSLVDNNVMAIAPSQDIVDPEFLYFFMSALRLDAMSRATTVPSLRKSDLEPIPFPLTGIQEQRLIVLAIQRALSDVNRLNTQSLQIAQRLEHLESVTLAAAFRGELVPQDPNDEPASVLLERIRAEREASGPVKGKRGTKASPSKTLPLKGIP